MAAGVMGKRLCGEVDRVPGLFYTSTVFWHMNYLPLVPLGCYIVIEGSEDEEVFQGTPVPWRLKSVLAGYLRGWLAAVAYFAGGVAAADVTASYVGRDTGGVIATIAVAAAIVGVLWFIFSTRSWWFFPVQVALILASAAVYLDMRAAPLAPAGVSGVQPGRSERRRQVVSATLVIANAAALLYTLTRPLTWVSHRRALELGRLVGIPPEQVTACLGLDPMTLSEWSLEEKR